MLKVILIEFLGFSASTHVVSSVMSGGCHILSGIPLWLVIFNSDFSSFFVYEIFAPVDLLTLTVFARK
jgi:hypothetical protein